MLWEPVLHVVTKLTVSILIKPNILIKNYLLSSYRTQSFSLSARNREMCTMEQISWGPKAQPKTKKKRSTFYLSRHHDWQMPFPLCFSTGYYYWVLQIENSISPDLLFTDFLYQSLLNQNNLTLHLNYEFSENGLLLIINKNLASCTTIL